MTNSWEDIFFKYRKKFPADYADRCRSEFRYLRNQREQRERRKAILIAVFFNFSPVFNIFGLRNKTHWSFVDPAIAACIQYSYSDNVFLIFFKQAVRDVISPECLIFLAGTCFFSSS